MGRRTLGGGTWVHVSAVALLKDANPSEQRPTGHFRVAQIKRLGRFLAAAIASN
jgi:hypothetical protein